MKHIDYYTILGVSRNGSQDKIRRAYRKGAQKYHPDVNKEPEAESRFKEINEAYGVLSDSEKRSLYDRYGKDWDQVREEDPSTRYNYKARENPGAEGFSQSFQFNWDQEFAGSEELNDFLRNIFTGDNGTTDQFTNQSFASPGRSMEAEIALSLDEIVNGGKKTITFQTKQMDLHGNIRPQMKQMQVKIPRGVHEGSVIRLKGQGESGVGHAEAGDLLLRVKIAPDSRFTLNGHDLKTTVPITPSEAVLGVNLEVETLDTKVRLKIPPRTQNNKNFRLKGKGLPKKAGRGDLYVGVEIRIPDTVSSEEELLFKKLSQVADTNPRDNKTRARGEFETA